MTGGCPVVRNCSDLRIFSQNMPNILRRVDIFAKEGKISIASKLLSQDKKKY